MLNSYGATYLAMNSVSGHHDATITTNQNFSYAEGKQVPAMGAFGLAALFGGLIAVAARLRRRVS